MNLTNKMFQLKGLYLLYFEIMLILRAIGPYLLLPHIIDTVFFWSAGFIGSLLILADFILSVKSRNIRKYDVLLILFLIVMLASSLLNVKYGVFENIKLLMWQAIFFLVIFQFSKDYGYTRYHKVFEQLLFWSWLAVIAVSLGMFVTQFGLKIPIEFKYYPVRIGWLGNRLFGVFTDPNFGAVISVIALFIGIKWLMGPKVNKSLAFLIGLNVVLQFCFIVLSGSRTAQVVLYVVSFVFVFFILFKRSQRNLIKTITVAVTSGLIVMGGLFVLTNVSEKVLIHVPAVYHQLTIDEEQMTGAKKKAKPVGKASLNRPDTQSGDISNMRFELWQSAFAIFKKSPLLGGSPGYYIPFAHDKLPHTLMGRDNLTAHNFFFLVLAATGGLGTIIFFVFFFGNVFQAIRYCFVTKKTLTTEPTFYAVLFAGAIGLSALFITELVLVSTIGALVFWSAIGLVNHETKTKRLEQN